LSQDHLLAEREMLATTATKTNLFMRQGILTGNIARKCQLQMQSAIPNFALRCSKRLNLINIFLKGKMYSRRKYDYYI
jgi:hypothetical protein